MNPPIENFVNTNILRHCYNRRDFSFGNPDAPQTVVLVGSCRIVPFLNFLRAYNALNRHPLELLCFNPVEMWAGPGHDVADCVNRTMDGYLFDRVDYLICEHLQNCGALNTVRDAEDNIYDTLGCHPVVHIRLPNWNNLHIYDRETEGFDREYAALGSGDRAMVLHERTEMHKERFLGYCRQSSFPHLEPWVGENWQSVRFGWTNNHPTLTLVTAMLEATAAAMGIPFTPPLSTHPLVATDVYASTGTPLTPVDYAANDWKF